MDGDELIAQELGVETLSNTQERYKERIRLKLEEVLQRLMHALEGPSWCLSLPAPVWLTSGT